MGSSEDTDLKRLLTLWHCEILYNLFREEDITIEDLKHIKYRHVHLLLKNFKMGVKIRFEHYLESWRNKIGIPLHNEDIDTDVNAACRCKRIRYNNNLISETNGQIDNPMESRENGEFNRMEPQTSLLSPKSNKDTETSKMESSPPNPRGRLQRQCTRKAEKPLSETEESQNLTNYLESKEDPPYTCAQSSTQSLRSQHNKCPYSLAQIIQMSGTRGMGLMQYYDEHNEFTNVQRSQLIQLICDFYESNEYHLSLYVSHALELEILQLFPTEELHYYRTEKRGKMYVKFTNMKRTRKERIANNMGSRLNAPPTMNRPESQSKAQSMINNEMSQVVDTTSCDTWPEAVEADIVIKPEESKES
uniref:Uncharacterized protein n=1 Tax=Stomoxys calcitrans TaxID=35570 RepID=A0A1I8NVT0_STOCA